MYAHREAGFCPRVTKWLHLQQRHLPDSYNIKTAQKLRIMLTIRRNKIAHSCMIDERANETQEIRKQRNVEKTDSSMFPVILNRDGMLKYHDICLPISDRKSTCITAKCVFLLRALVRRLVAQVATCHIVA